MAKNKLQISFSFYELFRLREAELVVAANGISIQGKRATTFWASQRFSWRSLGSHRTRFWTRFWEACPASFLGGRSFGCAACGLAGVLQDQWTCVRRLTNVVCWASDGRPSHVRRTSVGPKRLLKATSMMPKQAPIHSQTSIPHTITRRPSNSP